ncbi:MAG: 1-(5-phosphoribosyl)-5-[(5-phosphoribosylamino)methylideneamino]imidazole-4-carboxamide isomerase [Bacteroidota bacterium]|jgi:phosphoribosylformimino-5-aminoimidazole carboxamide ribotide isomerase
MQIIPAIDIIEGKCVRLTEGDYGTKKIYNEHPLEVALAFEGQGLKQVHLVDLDGARSGSVCNWNVLETIASKTKLQIDFGGGIKTLDEVTRVFDAGARWATIGSMAVKNETLLLEWMEQFGSDRFLLGADVRDRNIAVGGWMESTAVDIFSFIRNYVSKGVSRFFCTDISKDGRLEGPSTALYREIIAAFPEIFFIASGGVADLNDVDILKEAGCSGVIIGKALYEGRIPLDKLTADY